jgi:hypothetical protein
MSKWIKCSNRLPSEDGSYFVIGKMGRGSIPFKDGEWGKDHPHMRVFEEIIEWLDEKEPSFSKEQIMEAYNVGWNRGRNKNYDSADDFIRTEHGVIV